MIGNIMSAIAIIATITAFLAVLKLDDLLKKLRTRIGPQMDMYHIYTEPKNKGRKIFIIYSVALSATVGVVTVVLVRYFTHG